MNALIMLALLSAPAAPSITLTTASDQLPLPPSATDPFGLKLPRGVGLDQVVLEVHEDGPLIVEVQARVGWTATVDGTKSLVAPANDAVTRWTRWSTATLPAADLTLVGRSPEVARLLVATPPRVRGATSVQLELRELRVRVRRPGGPAFFATAIYVDELSDARG